MPTFAIAFSGHRPNRLPSDEGLLSKLHIKLQLEFERLYSLGCDTVFCGMAEGADRMCYETVISHNSLKSDIDKIHLHCVLPYADFFKRPSSVNRPDACLDLSFSDQVTVISQRYHPGCFHKRNRFMVDNADILLAVYDGSSKGGTAYTVEYARQRGRKVIIIHPFTLERTVIPCKEQHSKAPQA